MRNLKKDLKHAISVCKRKVNVVLIVSMILNVAFVAIPFLFWEKDPTRQAPEVYVLPTEFRLYSMLALASILTTFSICITKIIKHCVAGIKVSLNTEGVKEYNSEFTCDRLIKSAVKMMLSLLILLSITLPSVLWLCCIKETVTQEYINNLGTNVCDYVLDPLTGLITLTLMCFALVGLVLEVRHQNEEKMLSK